jgi:hypothetical protein
VIDACLRHPDRVALAVGFIGWLIFIIVGD